MRPLLFSCVVVAAVTVSAAEPRLRPIPAGALTAEQRELVAAHAGAFGTGADFRTLLVHPELVKGVLPFANYILSASTLSARHRELLILRTAVLTRSDYLWSKHQARAEAAAITSAERTRIVSGAGGDGWSVFDAALLRAADELHEDSFVTDATWSALAKQYSVHELMDAVFTIAETTMLANTFNSAGIEPDRPVSSFANRGARHTADRRHVALTTPRIEPVVQAQATPEIRAMLDPSGSGRDIAAVYRTFARHPRLYGPRQILSEYIRTKATLSPRVREMLILRIGWRCRSAYEWAAHAPAGRRAGLTDDQIRMLARGGYDGWSAADAAIVRAADELFDDDTISDATWTALDDQFDERQLLDVLITTGGYRMVSMVLNTFGVPAEPNSEPFP